MLVIVRSMLNSSLYAGINTLTVMELSLSVLIGNKVNISCSLLRIQRDTAPSLLKMFVAMIIKIIAGQGVILDIRSIDK